jgi:flavin-dependent dehydrogenase
MRHLQIVGAGPAGLAAALTARAADAAVTVFEKHLRAGMRFHGDFQGLENWTTEEDTFAELERLGLPVAYPRISVHEIVCFDSRGAAYRLRAADRPIFYLVKRGAVEDSLDAALVRQALNAGITVRWSTGLTHLRDGGIVAEGPHEADVIAVGHTFVTGMADGCYVAVAESLAPAGYAYLLVHAGSGTVATCLYRDFHDEKRYLERTVDFFSRHAGLKWSEARAFGGSGNVFQHAVLRSGSLLFAGESAGLQDPLFGFGLRYALLSGLFAAQAWLAGRAEVYERAWRTRLRDFVRTGIFNRRLYALVGNAGRQLILKHAVAGADPRRVLQRIYQPTSIKVALGAPALRRPAARVMKPGCDCTWCRCRTVA